MASLLDIGDRIWDYVTGGRASSEEYEEEMKNASKEYDTSMNKIREDYAKEVADAQAKRKSSKAIQQEGKEVAAAEASNKAGLAKKNAKAAAMQTSGSKLMSAIQGAQAANNAVQEGYDSAAARNASMVQSLNEADITNALTAAQNKADLANTAATNKLKTAQETAAKKKEAAENASNRTASFLNAGLGTLGNWLRK